MMKRKQAFSLALCCLVVISPASAFAHDPTVGQASAAEIEPALRAPAAVVDAFHAALGRGDIPSALDRLADDVMIFESGGAERSKAEYASHHAGADAAFAQAVPSTMLRRTGRGAGDAAWILTEGRTTGFYKGRAVDRLTTETMVLLNAESGWRITHVHWSSATAPASKPSKEK